MNIRDFALRHGLAALVHRHFVYNKPALPVDNNTMCALIYSRTIDTDQLGLNADGIAQALRQGELLADMDIIPGRILSGMDLRNVDGARLTAYAISKSTGKNIPWFKSAGLSYPCYDAIKAVSAFQEFSDQAVHAYLAENPKTAGLWTESAAAFEARIVAAVKTEGMLPDPILFDLNFEQLTLLHFLHVEKKGRLEIPCDKNAWCPKNGAGIAYGNDGAVMEFDPNFEMIVPIVP